MKKTLFFIIILLYLSPTTISANEYKNTAKSQSFSESFDEMKQRHYNFMITQAETMIRTGKILLITSLASFFPTATVITIFLTPRKDFGLWTDLVIASTFLMPFLFPIIGMCAAFLFLSIFFLARGTRLYKLYLFFRENDKKREDRPISIRFSVEFKRSS